MQEHHFTTNRTARYFTLGPVTERVRQLWYVCHGYGHGARSFLRSFAALDDGSRLIVAPEGLSRFYTNHASRRVGASWMTREDRLAEIADYVKYLDGLHEHVRRRIGTAHLRVIVLGFSQGAATVSRWIGHGSAVADRLVLWGGLIPPDLDLDMAWGKLEDAGLTLVIGDADEHVDATALRDVEAQLLEHEIPYETIRYAGGHDVDARVLQTLATR